MPIDITPIFYSRKETAEVLRISLRSVAYLIAHGELEAVKLGGRRLVRVTSVQRLAEITHRGISISR